MVGMELMSLRWRERLLRVRRPLTERSKSDVAVSEFWTGSKKSALRRMLMRSQVKEALGFALISALLARMLLRRGDWPFSTPIASLGRSLGHSTAQSLACARPSFTAAARLPRL